MSTANGLPDVVDTAENATTAQTIGKRKRSQDLSDAEQANGKGNKGLGTASEKGRFDSVLLDILEIMQRYA